jgi:hypothetical protein
MRRRGGSPQAPGDLTRAEETVIISRSASRDFQAELAAVVAQTDEEFHAALGEVNRIIRRGAKRGSGRIWRPPPGRATDPEKRKVEQANPVVVEAIRPHALAKLQEDTVHEAWRAVTLSDQPLGKQSKPSGPPWHGFDKALAAHAEIVAEDKRMVAACDAFLKVFTKR